MVKLLDETRPGRLAPPVAEFELPATLALKTPAVEFVLHSAAAPVGTLALRLFTAVEFELQLERVLALSTLPAVEFELQLEPLRVLLALPVAVFELPEFRELDLTESLEVPVAVLRLDWVLAMLALLPMLWREPELVGERGGAEYEHEEEEGEERAGEEEESVLAVLVGLDLMSWSYGLRIEKKMIKKVRRSYKI